MPDLVQAALAALCQHGQQHPKAAAWLLSESQMPKDVAEHLLVTLPITSSKSAEHWLHVMLAMADGPQAQVRLNTNG